MDKRLIYILLLLISVTLFAQHKPARVPARPGVIERIQPNGDTIRVRLHGDERQHWMTMEDGKTLVAENKKGYICYAKKKKNGQIIPTCKKVRNKKKK